MEYDNNLVGLSSPAKGPHAMSIEDPPPPSSYQYRGKPRLEVSKQFLYYLKPSSLTERYCISEISRFSTYASICRNPTSIMGIFRIQSSGRTVERWPSRNCLRHAPILRWLPVLDFVYGRDGINVRVDSYDDKNMRHNSSP